MRFLGKEREEILKRELKTFAANYCDVFMEGGLID